MRGIGLLRYNKLNPQYLLFSFLESFLVVESKCESSVKANLNIHGVYFETPNLSQPF